MASFLVIFVGAAPIVYWLVSRRAKPRPAKKHGERGPDTESNSGIIVLPDLPEGVPVEEVAPESDIAENWNAKGEPEKGKALPPAEANAVSQVAAVSEDSTSVKHGFHAVEHSHSSGPITNRQLGVNGEPLGASSGESLILTLIDGTADDVESKSAAEISAIGVESLFEEVTGQAENGTSEPDVEALDLRVAEPPREDVRNGFEAEAAAPVPPFSPAVVHPETVEVTPASPVPGTEEYGADDEQPAALLYRAPRQGPPRLPQRRPANQQASTRSASNDAPLDIQVGLTFDRFGFCSIVLLPKRTSDLDDEVEAKAGGSVVLLVAQDNWYQDLQFNDTADKLRNGLELKCRLKDHRQVRWRLSGRNFYVLATHSRTNKFVSTHRLHVGRPDVVLCVAEMQSEVEKVLAAAGCEGYTLFDESFGAPTGWLGLRGVLPKRALPLDQGTDPLYALKPESEVQIELDGGVCLRNSVWLAGYPPQIKIFGQSDLPLTVVIDGKPSSQIAEGVFAAEGFDQPGQHSVYCEGLALSRTYSIEEGPESWEDWPAYRFGQADICGPLVELKDQAAAQRPFAVPMSNPLLLGAEPGQVFRCSQRQGRYWKGFVPFDVVWALPAQPLICNKKAARILQFRDLRPKPLRTGVRSQILWCNAILDASRKGLQIENPSDTSTAYWREYRKAARDIRKGRR